MKTVEVYTLPNGKAPFSDWLRKLKDAEGKRRIQSRLLRLANGNYGDIKQLGDGIAEMRFFFGPGYRVYFGEHDNQLILLLCAGDKSSQQKDIKTAKQYWQEYQEDYSYDQNTPTD